MYRKDMGHPFTFPGRYPVNGGNREYAQEMASRPPSRTPCAARST